jgi:soluble lytic murein transglycosylase-like protein
MRVTDVTQYDGDIEAAAHEFLPFLDWRWLKAQLWQESNLKPKAKSPVGAEGIAQFMPRTWRDMLRAEGLGLPRDATPFDPEHAIRAAAYYDRQLWTAWRAPRPQRDRIDLMFASYNAGFGNLLRAQEHADGAVHSTDILGQLVKVTGRKNAAETLGYVSNIGGIVS